MELQAAGLFFLMLIVVIAVITFTFLLGKVRAFKKVISQAQRLIRRPKK